jgi:hypothetical protein
MSRCFWLGAALFVVAGCSATPTQLIVVVDTDFEIPAGLDEIEVAVTGPGGMRIREVQSLDGSETLPFTVAVIPESLDQLGPIHIEAIGRRDGGEHVRREARVTLVREQTLMLPLFLLRTCEGTSCPTDETCTANGCASIDDVPLLPWDGRPIRIGEDAGPGFDGGTDAGMPDAGRDAGPRPDTGPPMDAGPGCSVLGCDDGNPCTDDTCNVDGLCTYRDNAVACDDGTFCNGLDRCEGGSCSFHVGNPCGSGTTCDGTAGTCVGCTTDAMCPAPMAGSWGACGGFADACATGGTEERTLRTFRCMSGSCVPSDTTESQACSRATEGTVCGATSCDSFGGCSGSGCDTAGTQTRTCNDRVCSAGACSTRPRVESAGCFRPTDGTSCGATSCGSFGACGGFADTCSTSGSQSRTCTDYVCSGGGCGTSMRSESQGCSRGSTDGNACGGTSCGGWGPCEGFADACATNGTQSRTCTDYLCSGGGCGMTNRTETQACTRGSTDGASCAATTCDAWSVCNYVGTCDEDATQSRTCTDYVCGGGTCNGSIRGETQDCYRDRTGVTCGGGRCCDTGACICCLC